MPAGGLRIALLVALIVSGCAASAQELDSNATAANRSPASIADQIQDPAERAAFVALFAKKPPAQLLAESEMFLRKYPQSAFLAQAYETAASGSFDSGAYPGGLDYGRRSLTLLPENPMLLVAMADVEARESQNDSAITDARNALTYLDRFARPNSVPERDWTTVKRKQQAIAWFAIGRASLQDALQQTSVQKRQHALQQSKDALVQAKSLNGGDQEIRYVLGMTYLSQGKIAAAASELAAVSRSASDYSPRAADVLRQIYASQAHPPDSGFDAFVQGAIQAAPAPRSVQEKAEPIVAGDWAYAGSAACKSCHAGIYANWAQTGMARMLRPYQPQNVIGDFTVNNTYYTGGEAEYVHGTLCAGQSSTRELFARMVAKYGKHFFQIRQSDGHWHEYPVDYTIGSKWQQAYATKLPNGQIHVFPIQYNVLRKQWFNYWKSLDGEGTERSDPRNWERLDDSTSYEARCAMCHTSQLRNTRGGGFDADQVVFREPGIGCEMCHGPSERHVRAIGDGGDYDKQPMDPPVEFDKITSRQFISVCAQCHMQSALRNTGAHGELNYAKLGDGGSNRFFSETMSLPFGEFTRKGFYKDGRFSQSTFIVEALERSKCFRDGNASCGTCHDPHSHDFASNQTSLKFRDDPDKMCVGCHAQFNDSAKSSAHTHHRATSEGSRCVSCHMPKIMDALAFRARTHRIDDIPNAAMTARFGQQESPNACLLCHTDKGVDWLKRQLDNWTRPPASAVARR